MAHGGLSRLTYTQTILLSFFAVITAGTLLLCLPFASASGEATPLLDCAFTAVSAACVTGLIVVDTCIHWSLFGQIVILLLIQVGGLGLMTMITMFSIFTGRKVGLRERRLLMQSAGNTRLGGIIQLVIRLLKGTFIFEGAGAVILTLCFSRSMPLAQSIYYGIFHSVSAFCNAGFDLMGRYEPFSSFTAYVGDVPLNLTLMALIVIGGVGFMVWSDILQNKHHLRRYSLHSKIVLSATAVLIILGWVLFYIFERDASMAGMDTGERLLASLFQSVTTRTAGFNTVSQPELSSSGSLLSMALMFIGASPGSTGGGIKTTTLVVMVMCVVAYSRRQSGITVFRRRLADDTVKQAGAIVCIYILAELVATLAICALEPFGMREVLYEVISAGGTVGISMGITAQLGGLSRLLLMLLMFFGRVGGLSMALAIAERREYAPLERPTEQILIG